MENSELIVKALNYIKKETQKSDITIDDVAFSAGFSADYFNRIFLAHTGFNVMEYVRFTRLKKASHLLRTTDRDILDIALDCGYEAQESFTRAFKKQYGATPGDYRRKMKGAEILWGEYHNETIGQRIAHEFTGFKIADPDEAIDFLLEKDAFRHGYEAICFVVNGGAALYDGETLEDGFIWFQEYGDRIEGWIFSDDYGKIGEYISIFSDGRFDMVFFTLDSDEKIMSELKRRGVNITYERRENRIYRGEPYVITAPQGYFVRELSAKDREIIAKYYSVMQKRPFPPSSMILRDLEARDTLGNEEHSVFVFGIFQGGEMVGISCGGLQRAHGFVMNNCIETSILPGHESDELYRYAFKFVTNAVLEKGAVPFDDIQRTDSPYAKGNFDSKDLGYETVTAVCRVK